MLENIVFTRSACTENQPDVSIAFEIGLIFRTEKYNKITPKFYILFAFRFHSNNFTICSTMFELKHTKNAKDESMWNEQSNSLLISSGSKKNLIENVCIICYRFKVNGMGAPSVIPPFALGLGTPLTTGAYGNAIPSLGAFALATTQGMGQTNPTSIRGISNVLLVSNLNEEVSWPSTFIICFQNCC